MRWQLMRPSDGSALREADESESDGASLPECHPQSQGLRIDADLPLTAARNMKRRLERSIWERLRNL